MERRNKKSKLMKMVEAQYGEPLETLLPRLYNLYQGLPGMVEHMNLNKSTIWSWMMRLGVAVETRAYEPEEKTIEEKEFKYNERIRDLERLKNQYKHSLEDANDENKRLKEELEFAKRSSGTVY